MRKFKVIGRTMYGHHLSIGTVVYLTAIEDNGAYEVIKKDSNGITIAQQYIHPCDLEEIYPDDKEIMEHHAELAYKKLREANLKLNKVFELDPSVREIQDDISEIMDKLQDRYFEEEED